MTCATCGSEYDAAQGPCPGCAGAPAAPAGFWARGGASFIDSIVLAVAAGLASIPLNMALGGAPFLQGIVNFLVGVGFGCAYYTWMTSAYGQTLGKMAIGMRVVSEDGSPVPVGRALVRWLGYYASGLLLGIGYLVAPFNAQKRALHDFMAGTKVVYLPKCRPVLGAVLGVVSLLAAIVIFAAIAFMLPALKSMATKAQGQSSIMNVGVMRSVLSIYYGETEGHYPTDNLQSLLNSPKPLLQAIPMSQVPDHPATAQVTVIQELSQSREPDTGGWLYVNNPGSKSFGNIYINCTHTDSNGKIWSTY
ncbi:MAG: RDD family protein [Elusimicrobia bacterium]|nr:RDD family protein [Elusimicrobiota bacterium]